MKLLVLALSVALAGCGGECIPSTVKNVPSLAVYGAAADNVVVARSADELRAAIGRVHRAAAPPQNVAAQPEASGVDGVDAFVSATSFATNDVAVVQAGGYGRMRLVGTTTSGDRITLYFTDMCSPCAGGNPGSYEGARLADQAARAARVELVRVPKGAHVETSECSATCGTCARDVP